MLKAMGAPLPKQVLVHGWWQKDGQRMSKSTGNVVDPVAVVDNSCVGCGHCGEVSHAAALCPSFYRADIVENPGWSDRVLARVRGAVIGFLQRRRAARHWMPA